MTAPVTAGPGAPEGMGAVRVRPVRYPDSFRRDVRRMRWAGGMTYAAISAHMGISHDTVFVWCADFPRSIEKYVQRTSRRAQLPTPAAARPGAST